MQGLILAAGMGRRLKELTQENTKCMVRVNGVRLIDRLLEQLSKLNLKRVVIVIGYQGAKLRAHLGDSYHGLRIDYVENPVYNKTNNIYSLYLASDELVKDDTLLIESDLIFEDRIFRKLLNDPNPNVAVVDRFQSWMDGTVVTLNEDNSIRGFLSKREFVYGDIPSYYKTVNVYKFSKEFSISHYVPFLKAYSGALGNNEYYEQVLKVIALIDKPMMHALPLTGEKWYEIDDLQDLDIAESIFCPSGNQVNKLASRYGGYWRYPDLKDFCYLVNPYYPSPRMRAEMKNSFDALLEAYPSGQRVNALLAAKTFGVHEEHILVGNGAAELIKLFMEGTTGKVGFVYPTFEEYPNRICEARRVVFVPRREGFRYSAREIIRHFTGTDISTFCLVNPDNPSGNFLKKDEMFSLATWARENQIVLLVDESFVDFADESYSLLNEEFLRAYPNVCVMKSISKSYGVPGLRLGVLASWNEGLIKSLKRSAAIWNINSFGEFFLQICEKYDSEYRHACAKLAVERKRFVKLLKKVSFLKVFPSEANFVLVKVLQPYCASGIANALWKHTKILVKDCSHKKGFGGVQFMRFAIRNQEDNDLLLGALQELEKKTRRRN